MDTLLKSNPSLAISIIGILLCFIGLLFSILLTFVKRTFEDLIRAINALEKAVIDSREDIGSIKDRLAILETTCEMQRANCPNQRISFPALKSPTRIHLGQPQKKPG
jgi:hypothetical protein